MQEIPKTLRIINDFRMSGKLTRNEWAVLDEVMAKAAMTRATTLMQRGSMKGRAHVARRISHRRDDLDEQYEQLGPKE